MPSRSGHALMLDHFFIFFVWRLFAVVCKNFLYFTNLIMKVIDLGPFSCQNSHWWCGVYICLHCFLFQATYLGIENIKVCFNIFFSLFAHFPIMKAHLYPLLFSKWTSMNRSMYCYGSKTVNLDSLTNFLPFSVCYYGQHYHSLLIVMKMTTGSYMVTKLKRCWFSYNTVSDTEISNMVSKLQDLPAVMVSTNL